MTTRENRAAARCSVSMRLQPRDRRSEHPQRQRWWWCTYGSFPRCPGSQVWSHEDPAAPGGRNNDQVHRDEHQVIVPAAVVLPPDAGLPLEHLLLNRSEANQDQTNRRRLDEDSGNQAKASQNFRETEPRGSGRAELEALPAACRILQGVVAACAEDERDDQAQEEQGSVRELKQRWKCHVQIHAPPPW